MKKYLIILLVLFACNSEEDKQKQKSGNVINTYRDFADIEIMNVKGHEYIIIHSYGHSSNIIHSASCNNEIHFKEKP